MLEDILVFITGEGAAFGFSSIAGVSCRLGSRRLSVLLTKGLLVVLVEEGLLMDGAPHRWSC
jgi:hypothetical protein